MAARRQTARAPMTIPATAPPLRPEEDFEEEAGEVDGDVAVGREVAVVVRVGAPSEGKYSRGEKSSVAFRA